jgi:hypothetical protein
MMTAFISGYHLCLLVAGSLLTCSMIFGMYRGDFARGTFFAAWAIVAIGAAVLHQLNVLVDGITVVLYVLGARPL